jgi:starch phosphorylase
MARLTPVYSANRAVREYTDNHYIPAAKAYSQRASDGGRIGNDLVIWRREVEEHWPRLRFGPMHVEQGAGELTFSVQVTLDELNPDFAGVELFADTAKAGGGPVVETMSRGPALVGAENSFTYTKTVKTDRPAADFTPRIVAAHPAALVPLECARVIWYR